MSSKLKSFMMFAATAALFASCSQDGDVINASAERVAVQFSAEALTVTPKTRTTDGGDSWRENDPIGVFMVDNGTDDIAESVSNYRYKATATSPSSTFAADGSVAYYPVSGDKVDFIAYYPYKAAQTLASTLQVNVATQTDQAAIDLLWAKADKGGSGYSKADGLAGNPVNLQFSHQLSKLILTVKNGTGIDDLSGLSVAITGLKTKAAFSLTNGSVGAGSDPATIVLKTTVEPTISDNGVYEAIVLPESTSGVTVKFSLGGNTYTWDLGAAITGFQKGSKYEYEITINKTAVTVSGAISPWTSGGGVGSGNAE
jgi:endonuclease G